MAPQKRGFFISGIFRLHKRCKRKMPEMKKVPELYEGTILVLSHPNRDHRQVIPNLHQRCKRKMPEMKKVPELF